MLSAGTKDFRDAEAASASPLAEHLFTIPGIIGVFFGAGFITVSKDDGSEWQHLKPAILGAIMEHYLSGMPILADATAGEAGVEDYDEADGAIVTTIKELLETRVRPAVAQDGGDITFQSYRDGVVFLHMRGACAGCPSSTATLKNGIENLLRHFVPEVQEVRPV